MERVLGKVGGLSMNTANNGTGYSVVRDLIAGTVVFLVALPLCLGVALASQAPELFSGIVTGIVGGLLVGFLSKSHTSVSGPAAGLTAVVAHQIVTLGSYPTFLLAVVIAGLLQIALGILRAGNISSFFPSSVVRGLLAAIGVLLILKQFPHLLGHDSDPEGEMSFNQPDNQNTFSELLQLASDLHYGACIVGLLSLALLLLWDKIPKLKKSIVPAPLVVVVVGVLVGAILPLLGEEFTIGSSHLVGVPIARSFHDLVGFLTFPDWSQWNNGAVYTAALTLAVVASLETLLNLEAVDRLDPKQRVTPSNHELVAQGIGNMVSGCIGGLPMTSVIVRGSVNIAAGAQSKFSSIFHGALLLFCVLAIPGLLNRIPLSCLAAILIVTGYKLASLTLFKQMWSEGKYQFIPFIATVIAIVATDLLVGILIGMAISVAFVLSSNIKHPIHRVVERHLSGELTRIQLANQVSFLNRAALENALLAIRKGGHVLIDASNTNYIDPDVLSLIRQFKSVTGPARGVQVSLSGFREKYLLHDEITYVDYSTRDLQSRITPAQVIQILKDGNERFRSGRQLTRDYTRQMQSTSSGQHPLAVVLSCIDSRTPVELIFDLGLGMSSASELPATSLDEKSLGAWNLDVQSLGPNWFWSWGIRDAVRCRLPSSMPPTILPRGSITSTS